MVKTLTTLLVLLALTPAVGAAQSPPAQRARQLFEQGVAAMDAGDSEGAIGYFQQSYQLYPRASTSCNMALSLERTGRACDAQRWYRQCAALDTDGRFRDHANRQAAALQARCRGDSSAQGANPFVSGPETSTSGGGSVQVVEGQQPTYVHQRSVDHGLLGGAIPALVLGLGGIIGGAVAASEAGAKIDLLQMSVPGDAESPIVLTRGSAEANLYQDARTLSDVAIGLYVAGGVLAGLGAILLVVDLAQPGVFGGSARTRDGPRLAFTPLPEGGGVGQLTLRF